jgi:hypothetical protein
MFMSSEVRIGTTGSEPLDEPKDHSSNQTITRKSAHRLDGKNFFDHLCLFGEHVHVFQSESRYVIPVNLLLKTLKDEPQNPNNYRRAKRSSR